MFSLHSRQRIWTGRNDDLQLTKPHHRSPDSRVDTLDTLDAPKGDLQPSTSEHERAHRDDSQPSTLLHSPAHSTIAEAFASSQEQGDNRPQTPADDVCVQRRGQHRA
jgi:hypothetical protein